MLHRTTNTLIRRPLEAIQRLLVPRGDTRAPNRVDRAALFFRWTAVGLYAATCIVSGWIVLRALVG